MIYAYECPGCGHSFDVIKRASEYQSEETCVKCQAIAIRQFAPQKLFLSGTKVEEAEYNPGLGCVVRGKKHRAEIAKQKGLTEVGNEKPETLHKMYDTEREHRREKAWADADKGWVGAE